MYKNMLFGHIVYFFMSTLAYFKHLDAKLSKYLLYMKISISKILYWCAGFVKKIQRYIDILVYRYTPIASQIFLIKSIAVNKFGKHF